MQRKWFQYWFNSPFYHILYSQRNDAEAEFLIDNYLVCAVNIFAFHNKWKKTVIYSICFAVFTFFIEFVSLREVGLNGFCHRGLVILSVFVFIVDLLHIFEANLLD